MSSYLLSHGFLLSLTCSFDAAELGGYSPSTVALLAAGIIAFALATGGRGPPAEAVQARRSACRSLFCLHGPPLCASHNTHTLTARCLSRAYAAREARADASLRARRPARARSAALDGPGCRGCTTHVVISASERVYVLRAAQASEQLPWDWNADAVAAFWQRRPLAVATRMAQVLSAAAAVGIGLGLDYAQGRQSANARRRAAQACTLSCQPRQKGVERFGHTCVEWMHGARVLTADQQ